MKYKNYNIGEILDKKRNGANSPELQLLYEEIDKYESNMEQRIAACLNTITLIKPDNNMRWIQENAPLDIRYYVRCAILGKEFNVLMRSEKKWKTVADLGLDIEEPGSSQGYIEEWLEQWIKQTGILAELGSNVYESHAHYDLKNFNGVREQLLSMLHKSGVKHIIIPAIEYSSNMRTVQMFDTSEFDYVKYAFGSHPKYLWKENWTSEKWDDFRLLLSNPKCIAVGETGLDYSYQDFCENHRLMQMEMFGLFIEEANRHNLPVILHIRSGDNAVLSEHNADEDALKILEKNRIKAGAVLHCFGGTISDVEKYMNVGVKAFGIGGRITYGNEEFEKAVAYMPETSIILETDAPFMRVGIGNAPNTSLALIDVAGKIAELRSTTTAHILSISYENAKKLFNKT